eukprot:jgi/Picsp_1/1397/NSC_04876-R1_enhancer of rudimentary
MDSGHTIVLLQPEKDKLSRTFYDFPTLNDALAGIAQIFENKLREVNPGRRELTYDLANLYQYIDHLPDLSILVFDTKAKKYTPHGKTNLKNFLLKFVTTNR